MATAPCFAVAPPVTTGKRLAVPEVGSQRLFAPEKSSAKSPCRPTMSSPSVKSSSQPVAAKRRRVGVAAAAAAALCSAALVAVPAAGQASPVARSSPSSVERVQTPARKKAVRSRQEVRVAIAAGSRPPSFRVAASAAFIASAAATVVCHPIDTLKTKKQAEAMELGVSDADDASADSDLKKRGERGSKSALSLAYAMSLYKGVLSNILKEAPNAAIYLGCYELFKTSLLGLGGVFASVPLLTYCLAGMMGDAVGSVVRVPAEVLNKRLQLGLSAGWGDAIRSAFLSPVGLEATLASWRAVLWRDVPYGGLQIGLYEVARSFLSAVCGGGGGILLDVFAGASAGLVAAVLTTPADVLVTRMAAQNPQCYLETRSFMSPLATIRRILRDEGPAGVWSGSWQRGLYYAPLIGVFFAIYEATKAAISNPRLLLAMLLNRTVAACSASIGVIVLLACNKDKVSSFAHRCFDGIRKLLAVRQPARNQSGH